MVEATKAEAIRAAESLVWKTQILGERIAQLHLALEGILAIHAPYDRLDHQWCSACDDDYPCATVRRAREGLAPPERKV